MKKIFLTSTLALLFACTPPLTNIPRESSFFGIDFSKYTKAGFLITPEKYNGEYESIGIVNYVLVPGAELKTIKMSKEGQTYPQKIWVKEQTTLGQGLDSLYSIATKMGANGIMNFKVISADRTYGSINGAVNLSGYEISGFAIKRK